ncbi:hypothetical protein C5N14_28580 [Micromonospora sp. MW-13]|uniref:TfoX/Sxy family protein n=1 Tax=unclassified Micromonospora TaxID=2617518 RepID=UPI000E44CD6D|nr:MULTISPECIES: TfoX/Sxy family protein [unclassified Micromonospora]MCX4472218.1 TfoX/Sxy family protein [Micromonospora sp. NBC_01655]RGC65436.1 hypothetical protein C5N14_28580 [Micromonospora sp. MW-13]
MAYDEGLAARLRELLADEWGLTDRRMFGGLAVLVEGNIAVGVWGDELIVRADPAQEELLGVEPGVRPFDVTGRPMRGWFLVAPDACAEDEDLRRWVDRGLGYARTLPPR